MNKTLKAGVLGAGHLGKIHLRLLNQSDKFDLVGFYDPSPEVRNTISDKYGFKAFDSEEELIAAVNALARRLGMGNQAAPAYDSEPEAIELRTAQSRIQGSQGAQNLTPTEFTLLMALARAKGKSLELWQIYDVLGKDEQTLQKSALEAQLYRLRKKLSYCGAGDQALRALRLKGYRLYCPIYIK